jgi:hypothetical protein
MPRSHPAIAKRLVIRKLDAGRAEMFMHPAITCREQAVRREYESLEYAQAQASWLCRMFPDLYRSWNLEGEGGAV